MDLTTLYWIFILPNLSIPLGFIGFLVLVVGVVLAVLEAIEYEKKTANRVFRKALILPICIAFSLWLATALIPSQEQMKYIVGGYFATNIEGVEKLPENIVNAVNSYLGEINESSK